MSFLPALSPRRNSVLSTSQPEMHPLAEASTINSRLDEGSLLVQSEENFSLIKLNG